MTCACVWVFLGDLSTEFGCRFEVVGYVVELCKLLYYVYTTGDYSVIYYLASALTHMHQPPCTHTQVIVCNVLRIVNR